MYLFYLNPVVSLHFSMVRSMSVGGIDQMVKLYWYQWMAG